MKYIAISTLALSFFASATVFSAEVNAKKITCEEFVGLDETVQPKLVFFIEGASKSGKKEDGIVSVDEISKPVAFVVAECHKTPKVTVWKKVEDYVKSVSKKL